MTRTLRIEIRHKLPLYSAMTNWSHAAKAGTTKRWRGHVEKALMAEKIILSCNGHKELVWKGAPLVPLRLKYTQLIGINPKTNRVGNKYDRDNLIIITGKLVVDNLVHIGVFANDTSDIVPDPDTRYEYTGKLWHGVRVELEYKEPKEKP